MSPKCEIGSQARARHFIETKLFIRLVQEYVKDDEYTELQWFLAGAPESGPVIQGTGGVRNFEGERPVEASEAAIASSTI